MSLDTHPAKNALVVTYDTLVSAIDTLSRKQLKQTSKRQQLQIIISILDQLNENDLKFDKLFININDLSAKIIQKCPLLSNGSSRKRTNSQSAQDINLHLLYLINRRQSQLIASKEHRSIGNEMVAPSARLKMSTKSVGKRKSTLFGAQWQQQRPTSTKDGRHMSADVYSWILQKKHDSLLVITENFLNEFDVHLTGVESSMELGDCDMKHIETYLDGLYGDRAEKLESMVRIRHLSKTDENLLPISRNRLLICALIRSMTDTMQMAAKEDNYLCESILFCIIRLMSFSDISAIAFDAQDNLSSTNLAKIVLDLMSNQLKLLIHNSKEQLKLPLDRLYYTTYSPLLILLTMLELDPNYSIYQQLLSQPVAIQLYISLTGLLQLLSKQLARDLRISTRANQLEQSISLLYCLLRLFKLLTKIKEFINQIRGQNSRNKKDLNQPNRKQQNPLLDSLINLVGTLQLSRPGSGQTPSGSEPLNALVIDQQAMNNFYELELMAFEVINQLILDRRLKIRLIGRNLLKCVLRNLVSFLASRGGNYDSFESFHYSPALMIPLACLYELSREDPVKFELYKSKIVLKCLFEYLLCVTLSLKQDVESLLENPTIQHRRLAPKPITEPMSEVKLEPNCIGHYILSIWCNLTANEQCSIYGSDEEIRSIVFDHIGLVGDLMGLFGSIISDDMRRPILGDQDRINVYLHLKVIRNMTQFLALEANEQSASLFDRYVRSSCQLLEALDLFAPLAVENLAILSNMLTGRGVGSMSNMDGLMRLMEKLFSFRAVDLEQENDDLLLVSIILLAVIAKSQEICSTNKPDEQRERINRRMLRESNFILETKTTDQVMILSCLFALSQMMNHRRFLEQLTEQTSQANELINQLANLLLSSEAQIAKLACQLANQLSELERRKRSPMGSNGASRLAETWSSPIDLRRFVAYNGKWLDEIRMSRDELLSPNVEIEAHADDDADDVDVDDFEQVDQLNDAADLRSQSSARNRGLLLEDEQETETEVADDLDEETLADEAQDDSSLSGFDLNVIDSNSMIKHLVSRRELRSSNWFQNH